MDVQLSLLDTPQPQLKDSIYLALRPDEGLRKEMSRLRDELCASHGLGGKLVPGERFHLTLLDLGIFDGLPPRYLAAALQAGEAVSGLIAPFEFQLSHAQVYGNGILVLTPDGQVPPLKSLHDELHRQMTKQSLKVSGSFSPHLSFGYGMQQLAKKAVAPLTWPVTEIALIHSIKNQPKVIELGRWSLKGC